MALYKYNGDKLAALFGENISIDYGIYGEQQTAYSLIRINKKRTDGVSQFPFVRYLSTRKTAIDVATSEGWDLVINSGIGEGLGIENGVLITDTAASAQAGVLPLTIDSNGDLSFVEANTTGKGQQYINSGVVSAVCGFFPIVVDFDAYEYPTNIPNTFDNPDWVRAQRQVIGQFGNGDYGILTGDGRDFNNSTGFTIQELQALCMAHNFKFAYNLDGGGSTQTVLGKRNVNMIYDGTSGRTRNYFIVFNGTNAFDVPNA